jgi:hypothetical protein
MGIHVAVILGNQVVALRRKNPRLRFWMRLQVRDGMLIVWRLGLRRWTSGWVVWRLDGLRTTRCLLSPSSAADLTS